MGLLLVLKDLRLKHSSRLLETEPDLGYSGRSSTANGGYESRQLLRPSPHFALHQPEWLSLSNKQGQVFSLPLAEVYSRPAVVDIYIYICSTVG